MRSATIQRDTKETRISGTLEDRGPGPYEVSTGIRFFDHMLELFTKHGGFDLKLCGRRRSRRRSAPHRGRRAASCSASCSPKRSATAKASTAPATSSCRWMKRWPWSRRRSRRTAGAGLQGSVKVRLVGDLQTELVEDFFDGFVQPRRRQPARQGAVRPLQPSQDRSHLQVFRARHEIRLFHGCAPEGSAAVHQRLL